MKYLIFVFLLIFGSTILSAQDTLYVKKKRRPLIVDIKVIKKKTLNYTKVGSSSLRTISLKKVKKIKFGDDAKIEQQAETEETLIVEKEEFRSTILLQSGGLFSQNQGGLNYMHRLSPAVTEKISYWIQIGGGYHAQRTFRRQTEGSYLEFGGRVEFASKRSPQNRFHLGIDLNNQWVEGMESSDGGFLFGNTSEFVDDSTIVIQIPIGYTLRSDNGFYMSTGLEIATAFKIFPAVNFRFGYCFGR